MLPLRHVPKGSICIAADSNKPARIASRATRAGLTTVINAGYQRGDVRKRAAARILPQVLHHVVPRYDIAIGKHIGARALIGRGTVHREHPATIGAMVKLGKATNGRHVHAVCGALRIH